MIRVLIAEDQAMVRGALAALLTTEGDFEIAGDAPNGRAALDLAVKLLPDVLLTDIEMPELTGLELAAEIRRLHLPIKVVILTTFARAGYLRRALDAGVSGYLLKDARFHARQRHPPHPRRSTRDRSRARRRSLDRSRPAH